MERKRVTASTAKADAIKKQVIEFLMEGMSVQKAMDSVGRSVKTYEYYRKTDPTFATQIDKVRSMTQRGELQTGTVELPPFPEFSSKYLGVEVFTHQKHWIDLLEGQAPSDVHPSIIYEPGDPDLIIINTPPEHAKSTTITVNYALYQICRNPNIRILVVSKTQAMAQKFLLSIKNRLTHPRYQDLHLAFVLVIRTYTSPLDLQADLKRTLIRGSRTSFTSHPRLVTLVRKTQLFKPLVSVVISTVPVLT